MDYNGQLLDGACNNIVKENNNLTELPGEHNECIKHFYFLTHDGKEINQEFIEKYLGGNPGKTKCTNDNTFILNENKLLILGNNKKVWKNINLENIIRLQEQSDNDCSEILKIDGNEIWFFHQNIIAVYDFKTNKTLAEYNLSRWNVHQVMLDENNLWLISKNDGQLYGLKLN